MPHVPPNPLVRTYFPQPYGKDLATALRQIVERHRRHFPATPYYPHRKNVTAPAAVGRTVGGGTNGSRFDPLWGEAVDPAMGQTWAQPHRSDGLSVGPVEAYADPFTVYAEVQIQPTDKQLKRWGFEKTRGLVVTVPVVALDENGARGSEGDKLVWSGTAYTVMEASYDGPWMNTNLFLYRVLNCEQLRLGS